jgi:hypothetical protein
MAINETVQLLPIEQLTSQIGNLLSGIAKTADPEAASAELNASFAVWYLDEKDIQPAIANGTFPADLTNYQYHHILIDKRPTAFAITESSADGSWQVNSAVIGELAGKVEKAIQALDEPAYDDTEVRLLVIPSQQVYGFWMVERKEVYVVSVPNSFQRLHSGQTLPEAEFLTAVYEEIVLQKSAESQSQPKANRGKQRKKR